jgi:hypothetical protein
MRSRDRVLVAALFAGAFAALSCAEQRSSLARERIGDTVVVRAGAPELWPDTARLVEELRIGVVEGLPEYTFGVVRNVAVDATGNIYVLDAAIAGVLVYDPEGRHLRTIGQRGEGPGELSNPWGMAMLPDARLLVRDFRLGRINVYSAEGDPLEQWSIPTGFATGASMQVDTAGRVYTTVLLEPRADGIMRTGLMRLDSTGQVIDTVTAPYADYPVQMLVARAEQQGGFSSSYGEAPFSPQPVAALTPEGDFVAAITDRYAVTRFRSRPCFASSALPRRYRSARKNARTSRRSRRWDSRGHSRTGAGPDRRWRGRSLRSWGCASRTTRGSGSPSPPPLRACLHPPTRTRACRTAGSRRPSTTSSSPTDDTSGC